MPSICNSFVTILAAAGPALTAATSKTYRYLPGDAEWPSERDWQELNNTVGGNLIRGVPLAQPCYGETADAQECSRIQNDWAQIDPL